MAKKNHYLTDDEYVEIGRRHGSDEVDQEASVAESRWRRDLDNLGEYGHGPDEKAAFDALWAKHGELRAGRSDVVSGKKTTVIGRDTIVSAAWAWVDKVGSVLGRPCRADQNLAVRVEEAMPREDSGLGAGIVALAAILDEVKGRLAPHAKAAERVAESKDLAAKLGAAPGQVSTAKAGTVTDTAELDLLDGKIYIAILDLNKAGRKAIRNGNLKQKLEDYTLKHLKRSGNPKPHAPPPPPSTPPQQ